MRKPTSRRIITLSIMLLSLVPLSTALAGHPPLVIENSYSGAQEIVAHCGPDDGGFDILSTYTAHDRDQYNFRADGTWASMLEHHTWNGILTNSRTGKTVPEGPDHLLMRYLFADDGLATSWDTATISAIYVSGVDYHTNLPRIGRVVHDAGLLIVVWDPVAGQWNVTSRGRHDINALQDAFAPVYCPILAGG